MIYGLPKVLHLENTDMKLCLSFTCFAQEGQTPFPTHPLGPPLVQLFFPVSSSTVLAQINRCMYINHPHSNCIRLPDCE